ncbi:MAG: outer membrane lipid asymmetry maintenance protein MlaD [Hydrogenophilales bacterium 16-64-46]|nr:MAG: outer membrane lipid asymmetry maintenance protein MlaD [Hydrogenophilales bacterium 12-64-13]OYZ05545.1 MAG: outer membrane lipid asymmetry maintenance protein MlaD [Hydrogenophilales bacterium 16-64-46]OZA40125.1 MAG: outer membrane lipid asymmetry maintenance protein MlaD [Hydrogenophilales bacterium 17-64-34]HQT00394.1 outer membrane lipid asymmetry maintenance protein MlaD [Thiobacillus sp.]
MNKTVLDLWVGLFVVAGIAALLFLALKVGSMNTVNAADSYDVVARFENIGGLKARAPVKSAGVVVGRVDSIQFDTELYEAKVTIRVDKRYPFPRDTSAAILTSGLLGEQYIGLAAGGDSVMLKSGDTLKITQDAVVLENLIGQFLYGKAQEGSPQ